MCGGTSVFVCVCVCVCIDDSSEVHRCVRVCVCVNIRKWGENMFVCKQHMVGKCPCPPTYLLCKYLY